MTTEVYVSPNGQYTRTGKQVIIAVTMPATLTMPLDEAAERRGISRSACLRLAVEAQIERDAMGDGGD
jgi:metal-responsive CopG/Arc/MetJ family transcriptional regulator